MAGMMRMIYEARNEDEEMTKMMMMRVIRSCCDDEG